MKTLELRSTRSRAAALAVCVTAAAGLCLPLGRADAEPDKDELTFVGVTILDGLGSAPESGSVSIADGRIRLGKGAGRRGGNGLLNRQARVRGLVHVLGTLRVAPLD